MRFRWFVRILDRFAMLGVWWASRRDTIARLQREIYSLREDHASEVGRLQSEIAIHKQSIAQLAEVIERDRERVRSETAIHAASREIAGHRALHGA